MEAGEVTITVKNWAKYNPRNDRNNYSWLRFENRFFYDQAIFSLNDSAIVLLLFILCECSSRNSESVTLKHSFVAAILKKTWNEINQELQALVSCGVVTAESRRDDGVMTADCRRLVGLRNETNETNDIVAANADDHSDLIERIYRGYPRRKGGQNKPAGIKRIKRLSLTDLERFGRAVANYAAYCIAEKKTGTEFVMQFSTFTSRWEEWAELTQPATKPIQTPEEFLREEDARRAAELANTFTLTAKTDEESTHETA